jgi:hypothetical protein
VDVNDTSMTPPWKRPTALQRGLARVRKAWGTVWTDTHLVMGKSKASHVEFVLWSPVLVILTPVIFVMGTRDPVPVPLFLACPACKKAHIDRGPWRTRSHRTHKCEYCNHLWRPTDYPTVGV